jgi:oxygen-independent coproporphyrinogen-3 oxidase
VTAITPPPTFDPGALARIPPDVLARFDVPGPRYTSYPTAPAWRDFAPAEHRAALERSAASGRPLSIYVHLPFCESLCIYCGCNVVITKRHDRAAHYLEHLFREIDLVAGLAGASRRTTVQVAWGGGTPTFLAPEQVESLMGRIRERFPLDPDAEVGIEVDPRVTTREHVRSIVRSGFNRISMGVQDFDPEVQEEIHRVQSFELTKGLVDSCREEGLRSVNLDLVYGLPKQRVERFDATIDLVRRIDPDRISAFSYAHVPWLKPQQRKFRAEDLPTGPQKFAIFTRLVERLCAAGYHFVGMDHFAKPENELAVAQATGGLWRNFQGFTTKRGTDVIGLGVTSISSFEDAFAQNAKDLPEWAGAVCRGDLPTHKGMVLTADDRLRREVIQRIMCTYRLDFAATEREFGIRFDEAFPGVRERLRTAAADGAIDLDDRGFALTSWGRVFVRNVCMAFDAYLGKSEKPMFSRTV